MFNSTLFTSGAVKTATRVRTRSAEYFDSDDEDQYGPITLSGGGGTGKKVKIEQSVHASTDEKTKGDTSEPAASTTNPPSLVLSQTTARFKYDTKSGNSTRSKQPLFGTKTAISYACAEPLPDLKFTTEFRSALSVSPTSQHDPSYIKQVPSIFSGEPFSIGHAIHDAVKTKLAALPRGSPLDPLSSTSKIASVNTATSNPIVNVTSLQGLITSKIESNVEVLAYRELPLPAELTQAHLDKLANGAYLWVLCVTASTSKDNTNDDALRKRFSFTTVTDFGPGVELDVLTECALQDAFRTKSDDNGDTADVCIGVVDALDVYHTSETFMTEPNSLCNSELSQAIADGMACALSKVYSAVQYTPHGQKGNMERKTCVVWENGAAVPLAVLSIRQKLQCRVCFDAFGAAAGLSCAHKCGTFTCWECLLQSYKMVAQPGAIQGQSSTEGELLCSDIRCRCPVKMVDLVRNNASETVLKAQEDFKIHMLTNKKVAEALREQEGQIRGEYARIEQIKDADEKAAAKMRLKIVDECLTLRCPRCKTAFMDFEGCFALRCAKNSCRCGFCAWCLQDCGDEKQTHQHVKACPENQGKGYFNTEKAFRAHHKQKRTESVRLALQEAALSSAATEKLKEMVKRDLEDLDIQLWEVFAASASSKPAGFPAPPKGILANALPKREELRNPLPLPNQRAFVAVGYGDIYYPRVPQRPEPFYFEPPRAPPRPAEPFYYNAAAFENMIRPHPGHLGPLSPVAQVPGPFTPSAQAFNLNAAAGPNLYGRFAPAVGPPLAPAPVAPATPAAPAAPVEAPFWAAWRQQLLQPQAQQRQPVWINVAHAVRAANGGANQNQNLQPAVPGRNQIFENWEDYVFDD